MGVSIEVKFDSELIEGLVLSPEPYFNTYLVVKNLKLRPIDSYTESDFTKGNKLLVVGRNLIEDGLHNFDPIPKTLTVKELINITVK